MVVCVFVGCVCSDEQALLLYLYTGKLDTSLPPEQSSMLLKASVELGLEELEHLCRSSVVDLLQEDTHDEQANFVMMQQVPWVLPQ